MIWLQRFGLWLAGLGGWAPPVVRHEECLIELQEALEDARQADQLRKAAEQAANTKVLVAEGARKAFEEAYRRGETARQRAETALHEALVEKEQAAGTLRAYTAPNLAPALFHRAKELVTLHLKNSSVSGEAKRHQVYAQLRKEFRDGPHRDIGLAIELALR